MNNIVSFSGGKDSTAMLLMMIEKKIPIDHIIFFDTGCEFPGLIKHINKLEKHINRRIIRLKHHITYEEGFKRYGFPSFNKRWCTALKVSALTKYCNKNKPYTQWIGYSYNERKRVKKTIGFNYPLVDWKITGERALKYCSDRGFTWDGLYDLFDRVSCWNCPLQTLKELKALWLYFPAYWQELIEMQKTSTWQFRKDYTLEELDEKFRKEEHSYQLEI